MSVLRTALAVLLPSLFVCADLTAQVARRRIVSPSVPSRGLSACAPGLVVRTDRALDVAVDATHVYYGVGSDLRRVPKNGGAAPVTIAQAGSHFISMIALDGTHAYFISFDEVSFFGSVTAVPKSGGAPRIIVSNVLTPSQINLDANYVYLTSFGTPSGDFFLSDAAILRVKKDGSEVKTLVTGVSFPVATAVVGPDVFYSDINMAARTSSLRRVSVDGGESTVVEADTIVFAMATDGTYLYYSALRLTTFAEGVWRRRPDGATSVVLENQYGLYLVVAGTALYYLGSDANDVISINAVSITGGTPRTVVAVEPAYRFTADECLLYYSTGEGVERSSR
jgi:hypothetical protein